MTIRNIIEKISELNRSLEEGRLSTDEVVEMTDLSRDLYERLVVIRHRSYEELLHEEQAAHSPVEEPEDSIAEEKAEVSKDEVKKSENLHAAEAEDVSDEINEPEGPSIRVGAAAVSPNQISLIDSIEEIKRMEKSLNDQLKDDSSATLSQRLKQKPIEDLVSAIGINQRFRFIKQLFDEDKAAFEDAVNKLNGFSSFIEADEFVQNDLKDRFDWQMKDPVVKEMIGLIERRYL